MKITVPEDCGNAPRKKLIHDFTLAFAENNKEKILEFMADDIEWIMVGDKIMNGKEEAAKSLETMGDEIAEELILDTIITHGDTAACDGIIKYSKRAVAFCDVYKFTGHDKDAKIRQLTGYAIELK
ncbi:MAG TPA: nuclear transport factor 2 family protein [Patescibacteria group bacterium]|nr:nuclear transport factor 2 family protein [Patescibacteria group bacterium]